MHVLYLTQYYPPELSAAAIRAHGMVEGLRAAGHRVTVITEFPHHPRGVLAPEHRSRLFERIPGSGGELVRVWVRATPRKTFATRLGLYLSFMVSAAAAGTLAVRGPFDVLYASSPPLLVGAAALAIRARWRVPLVFEVADLWPASAVAVGELRRPGAIRLAEWLERKCYGRAAHIVVASEGMRDALAARGVPPEKLSVIFNGADTLRFTPQPEAADHLRRRLGLEGTTVVLYAGLHGLAQGLEVVLDAADRLRERRHIRLLLIGEGPTKSALIEAAHRRGLDNVVFHPGVAPEEMPAFFSLAQVALVPVRAHPVFDTVLPMKLFESWACACPTIVGVGGEARALVERAQAGVAVEPENAAALAAAISALAAAPERCRQLGVNGRRFVESRFSRQSQVDRLCELLARVSGERM